MKSMIWNHTFCFLKLNAFILAIAPVISGRVECRTPKRRSWRNDDSNDILIQNFPNPFNNYTNIRYRLEKPDFVSIEIFNINGQLISVLVNEYQSAGDHTITWNADDLEEGFYFCKLQSGSLISVRKMIRLK
jgi:hypothetical protein